MRCSRLCFVITRRATVDARADAIHDTPIRLTSFGLFDAAADIATAFFDACFICAARCCRCSLCFAPRYAMLYAALRHAAAHTLRQHDATLMPLITLRCHADDVTITPPP